LQRTQPPEDYRHRRVGQSGNTISRRLCYSSRPEFHDIQPGMVQTLSDIRFRTYPA